MVERWSSPRRARRTIVQALVVTILAAVAVLGGPGVASAHTDFESSTPADGDVVEGPLAEVVVNFTNPAEPANEGFELLDPSGQIVTPTTIDETDGTSFVLSFEPPLVAGTYGLRWSVRAGDAHPIDGSFRFEVTEPVATTVPPTTAPASTEAVTESTVATTVAPPPTSVATDADIDADAALAAFLADDGPGDDGSAMGRVGRIFTFLGLIFGLGSLSALVWVIRGRRDELLTELNWVRLAGIVIATGGFIELVAAETTQSEGLLELLGTKPGIAAAGKIVGGLAVFIGLHPGAGRITSPPMALSAAVATEIRPTVEPDAAASRRRWEPTTSAWLGLTGFAVVLVSFWFDGHTVSKGPWVVHAAVNSVHLVAAAVWAGGVFAMTTFVWMRRRAAEQTDVAAMVVRFSTPATASLVAVIAAGLVMTVMILDQPADLFDTEWGRLMLAKTAAVALAAGLGGYNHFRLRPALERAPDDATLARELRTTLTVESVVFAAVVVITAWLVAAAM